MRRRNCTNGAQRSEEERKSENVDEEYENLSEVVNMKHNCIDGSCHFTCQVFPFTF